MLVAARSPDALRRHYLIERELADRLRSAPDRLRRSLYPAVYDELLRRVPDHPQLRARFDPGELDRRSRAVDHQLAFLSPAFTPRTVFMEVGAGDCALAIRAAGYVERVYAIEVSESITGGVAAPCNFRLALSDGVSIPVPEASVDVAFSNQLMEHLHPRDAAEQLANIHRALAPGGVYFCITPNRLYGPRDISATFDEVATGLHLREYSARELRRLFLDAGFSSVRFYAGARGTYARIPFGMISLFEEFLESLPYRMRKRLADNAPARALLGLRVAAVK